MKSYITSYDGLFARRDAGVPEVRRIEIPLIQRDYAQGRDGGAVARIRDNFLDVLYNSVTDDDAAISLDFIYGDVVDGTLRPLDGQQRLTTLFLLHWYLAWRTGRIEQDLGWKRFEYATRPSARRFCACLVASAPPLEASLRAWFEDQYWFVNTWRHDPTIQSMLVMIESIHARFADADCAAAWARLIHPETPAVSFHLLPIEEMGLSEDLYIKMNSRGKPLTPFENFKARFEQVLEASLPDRVNRFAGKADVAWPDLLWPYRGEDNIVDDEFLRYFQFVTELCAWLDGVLPSGDIDTLAERVYGPMNPKAEAHLDFLEQCFDTWAGTDIGAAFAAVFSLTPASPGGEADGRLVLFGAANTVDLFAECCTGESRLGWPRTLLLYAVLLHRLEGTPEFGHRLRVLRNLIEASGNELRADRMPGLLRDVRQLVVDGTLEDIAAFNQAQVADEKRKRAMLDEVPTLAPDLYRLEDHPLLRGALAAFELEPGVFARRARAFHELFADASLLPVLTGAMLAAGDYARRINHRFVKLGSSTSRTQWREEILTGAARADLADVRSALGAVLDTLAMRTGDIRSALKAFTEDWLARHDGTRAHDWRWYLVRYPVMRTGRSGIYACAGGTLGYRICMLDKQAMSSYYRDPFLSAILHESGVPGSAVEGMVGQNWSDGPWFSGYESWPRWMRLKASGVEFQCIDAGIQLRTPSPDFERGTAFARICADHGIGADFLLAIPQVAVDDNRIDAEDRVRLSAALLRDLVAAGL
jgi:hypothetical protein